MAKLHLAVLDQAFDVTVTPSFLAEAECPASVKYGRIDKKPRRADLPLEVGRTMHKIFEEIIGLRRLGRSTDTDAVNSIVLRSVRGVAVQEMDEIRRMTGLFLTNFHPRLEDIVGVEEEVALDENGEPTSWDNAAYGGYLDLVQISGRRGRVSDHKCQYNIFSKDELERHFQTTFYLMLLRKLYPFLREFELEIYYARHGFSVVTARTPEQLDACEQEVMVRVEAIRRWKNFDPVPGQHCTICDGRFECPKGQDLAPVPGAVITPEQATSVAGRIRVMELVLKELKKKLREYCKEHGEAVASPSWKFGFVPRKKVEFQAPRVAAVLLAAGIDPAPYQRMDAAGLKRFLREVEHHDPALFQEVMSVADTKTATTFKGYKPGAEEDDEEVE